MYIDDVRVATTPGTFDDDVFDIIGQDVRVMPTGPPQYIGDIADIWVDVGSYLDLSVEANRRKFISASGHPVFLGNAGEIPTGAPPDIFLNGDATTWQFNKGAGDGFAPSGAINNAATDASLDLHRLRGHWRLDEIGGTAIADSSGNGANGTADTAVTPAVGQIAGAIAFGPGEDEIVITDNSFDNLSPLSVCAWFNTSDINYAGAQEIVTKSNNGVNDPWQFYIYSGGQLVFYNNEQDEFISASGLVQENTWHHGCAVWDGTATAGSTQLYLDGSPVASSRTDHGAGTLSDASFNVSIGASNNGAWDFVGLIDDVRIYNRLLTPSQVAAIQGGKQIACAAPDGGKGDMIYNDDYSVMQYCNGAGWQAMGPQGNGGAGCANPSGAAGDLVYNDDFNVMQFCEGDSWISIGK
jgi:hypothetical protein